MVIPFSLLIKLVLLRDDTKHLSLRLYLSPAWVVRQKGQPGREQGQRWAGRQLEGLSAGGREKRQEKEGRSPKEVREGSEEDEWRF